MRLLAPVLALFVGACCSTTEPVEPPTKSLELVFSDPSAFLVTGDEVELKSSASYEPPHRSPRAIALLDDAEHRSFVLDVDAMQTGREYGHRDLCFFFGYESPERYYYVHLATTPDKNAHNVFLVDGAPRRNLLDPQETGVDWGTDAWHHVRIERDVDAGTVRVFFDDMETPVLETSDATIEWGRIGVGSFDDTGRFRNVEVTSYESRPSSSPAFPGPSLDD